MITPGKVGRETIRQIYAASGIPQPEFMDEWYMLPSLKWVQTKFANYVFRYLAVHGRKYRPGKDDCDDFGETSAECARDCMRITAEAPEDTAIAFQRIIYTPDRSPSQRHFINVFPYRDSGGEFHVGFFEPQNQQVITLSTRELSTCAPPF